MRLKTGRPKKKTGSWCPHNAKIGAISVGWRGSICRGTPMYVRNQCLRAISNTAPVCTGSFRSFEVTYKNCKNLHIFSECKKADQIPNTCISLTNQLEKQIPIKQGRLQVEPSRELCLRREIVSCLPRSRQVKRVALVFAEPMIARTGIVMRSRFEVRPTSEPKRK